MDNPWNSEAYNKRWLAKQRAAAAAAREAAIARDVALIADWLFDPRHKTSEPLSVTDWVRARHEAGEATG